MGERIKIAYLIDTIVSDKAGTEKQLMELLRRIDRAKFEPILVCLRGSEWLERQSLPYPVAVLGYEGFLKRSFPSVVRRFCALIEQEQIRIVQTFFEDALFVGLLGKFISRTRPVLLASRRDLGLGADELWYHHLFRFLRRSVNRRVDGIVANAEAIRAHIVRAEGFPAERIQVIPNGVDLPHPLGRPEIYDRQPADLRIVITANLKPIKRLDVFLRALARLKGLCPGLDFRAYILGEGRLRPELTKMVEELGIAERAAFLGSREDVWDFLSHADIGVLCSDREGLSNAILEYMACGLPVVATDVGGNGELVGAGNGLLVPPGDAQALAEALARLALSEDLRTRMGQASLDRIRTLHLWEQVLPAWENYYAARISTAAA